MRNVGHGEQQGWEESPRCLRRSEKRAGWDRRVTIAVGQLPGHTTVCVSCHGFTLIEMVLTAAVAGVLMVGMGSAMMFAGRALPNVKGVATTTITTAEALDQITTDLQYAISVTQRSAGMIEFTVHDRNGDDIAETIRYSWSGMAKNPLTRQYNGGTAETILGDVYQFNLSYTLKTVSTEIPQGNESAETILASYSANKNLYDFPIKDGEWYAEYVFPSLPANTVSWKVTRVLLPAKLDGATLGQASIQLRRPTLSGRVSDVVIDEKTLLESVLTTKYVSQQFTFSNASGLAPTQGVWIVGKWLADAYACRIQGQSSGVTAPNLALAQSLDGGSSWSTLAGQSLLFTLYGTVTTAGTPQTQNTYYLEGVNLTLRAGSDTQATVQTGVRLLNRPAVTQ
jgi:prepilin-type N-terminal cleavage/methylation domain-containing protein